MVGRSGQLPNAIRLSLDLRATVNVGVLILRACAHSIFILFPCALPLSAADDSIRQLTVVDALATARFLEGNRAAVPYPGTQGNVVPGVYASQDHTQFAITLLRGDPQRNGNWLEIYSGGVDLLSGADQVAQLGRVFSNSLGGDEWSSPGLLTLIGVNPMTWLPDNRRFGFLWGDEGGVIQLFAANAATRQIEQLTHHPTDVMSWAATKNGTLIYQARRVKSVEDSRLLGLKGFVVRGMDPFRILRGDVIATSDYINANDNELYVLDENSGAARAVRELGRGVGFGAFSVYPPRFSPDGRFAIVYGPPLQIQDDWSGYTAPLFRESLRYARSRLSQGEVVTSSTVNGLFLVDVKRGVSRPLWQVPNAPNLGVRWLANGRAVLLTNTFLPIEDAASGGLEGQATVEIDVETGKYRTVSTPKQGKLHPDTVIGDGKAFRLIVRQNANTPPKLLAQELRSGTERLLLDPNSSLKSRFHLGRVENVTWSDVAGRMWRGRLYYPVHYANAKKFPLVIQTHGVPLDGEFNLYGLGEPLGPNYSVYAAHSLASYDIAVLQMQDIDDRSVRWSADAAHAHMLGYEAAVRHWEQLGLSDSARVGLQGWSLTGFHVEYALTQSDFVFAAAIADDNIDASYVQSVYRDVDDKFPEFYSGVPLGAELKGWLEQAPGFNAARICTPLRLQVSGGGGLWSVLMQPWELYSHLKQLRRPVELYVVPDIQRAAHTLQNPAQSRAFQQGAVDWWRFWLKDEQDAEPSKVEQYARWRELRLQRDSFAREPRAPLLTWSATPRVTTAAQESTVPRTRAQSVGDLDRRAR